MRPFEPGDHHGHHDQYGHLAREGLGGGDADLGADVDVGTRIGGAGNRRTHHVADAVDEGPPRLGQFDGSQRVGRFTRLGDGQHDVVRMDDGVAVAEFRSVLHLYLDAAEILEEVFADHAGVPRGAARHADDAAGVQEPLLVVENAGEDDIRSLDVDAAADTVGDRARLFEDLLQHEVRIAALLQLGNVHLQFADVDLRFDVVEVDDAEGFVAVDDGDFAVVQVNHILDVFGNRGGVRGEEVFAVADADYQRAALAGSDDFVLVVAIQYGDGVGADHLVQRGLYRLEERAVVRCAQVVDDCTSTSVSVSLRNVYPLPISICFSTP